MLENSGCVGAPGPEDDKADDVLTAGRRGRAVEDGDEAEGDERNDVASEDKGADDDEVEEEWCLACCAVL